MQTECLVPRMCSPWMLDCYKTLFLGDGPDSSSMELPPVGTGTVFTTLLRHGMIDLEDMRRL